MGIVLAKMLGMNFIDTDLVIQQREGLLLQDILDQFGVKHFLQVEEEAIRTVDCRRTVIAPGGSAVCREPSFTFCPGAGRFRRWQELSPRTTKAAGDYTG